MFLGEKIRQVRESLKPDGSPRGVPQEDLTVPKMSQEELARRADVSVMTIGRLERGEVRRPQRKTLERIAVALGEDADFFGLWMLDRPKNWYARKVSA